MLDAKLKAIKKHGEEHVKNKPVIEREELRRLKESGPHKPNSKSKSSKGTNNYFNNLVPLLVLLFLEGFGKFLKVMFSPRLRLGFR